MSGIAGFVGPGDASILGRMCDAMTHRGPDDSGQFIDAANQVGLGARRLSVIDLCGGHQPMHNEDGTVQVVFDGEIYNHKNLRHRMESRGHTYRTNCDTETLVHLYEEHGEQILQLLRGMFAFALYDTKRPGRLFLARDRLGIKPLYYWHGEGRLVFASELKSLLEHPLVPRQVDPLSLDMYLALQYVPAPRTMLMNIHKLPAGHALVFQEGQPVLKQYWDVEFIKEDAPTTLDDAAARMLELCEDAVRIRMQADVPLGALLSGGLDASTIAALMCRSAKVKTFTVSFDEAPNANGDAAAARQVAKHLGTEHHEITLTPPQAEDLLPKLVWHLDEPVADRSALTLFSVYAQVGEHVKVVLSGEGGDEVFGGYPRYRWFAKAKYLERRLPASVRRWLQSMAGILPSQSRRQVHLLLETMPDNERHLRWIENFSHEDKARLYKTAVQADVEQHTHRLIETCLNARAAGDAVNALMYLDMKTWLQDDVLATVDRMSMACSLEVRLPFLDHNVVEYASTLPSSLKIQGKRTRVLMRHMMRGILPEGTLQRSKGPCDLPAAAWFRGGLLPFARDMLLASDASCRDYFHQSAIGSLLDGHARRQESHQQIWNLLCLELWLRAFVRKPNAG